MHLLVERESDSAEALHLSLHITALDPVNTLQACDEITFRRCIQIKRLRKHRRTLRVAQRGFTKRTDHLVGDGFARNAQLSTYRTYNHSALE